MLALVAPAGGAEQPALLRSSAIAALGAMLGDRRRNSGFGRGRQTAQAAPPNRNMLPGKTAPVAVTREVVEKVEDRRFL